MTAGTGRGAPVATRTELLARKAQIELAEQGRELLEQKRAALMKEIMRVAGRVMAESGALQAAADLAHRALARAEAVAGTEAVRSAALAAGGEFPLEIETSNVMGVRVPHFEPQAPRKAWPGLHEVPVEGSITLDEAAGAFAEEVEAILRLADSELRLLRLTGEIRRTSRRVNALKHYLIPRLEAERDRIRLTLDERERSDRFRLKLAKKKQYEPERKR
ncbi:MAG TPA: V-type ATP synthase subunit D [Anaerolineales bacterium]|nr:V-type ATP synthase subunit D [Anaerolineales bacterium]